MVIIKTVVIKWRRKSNFIAALSGIHFNLKSIYSIIRFFLKVKVWTNICATATVYQLMLIFLWSIFSHSFYPLQYFYISKPPSIMVFNRYVQNILSRPLQTFYSRVEKYSFITNTCNTFVFLENANKNMTGMASVVLSTSNWHAMFNIQSQHVWYI